MASADVTTDLGKAGVEIFPSPPGGRASGGRERRAGRVGGGGGSRPAVERALERRRREPGSFDRPSLSTAVSSSGPEPVSALTPEGGFYRAPRKCFVLRAPGLRSLQGVACWVGVQHVSPTPEEGPAQRLSGSDPELKSIPPSF